MPPITEGRIMLDLTCTSCDTSQLVNADRDRADIIRCVRCGSRKLVPAADGPSPGA